MSTKGVFTMWEVANRTAKVRGQSSMKIRVEVLETKKKFGTTMYHIKPIEGEGSMWVKNLPLNIEHNPTLTKHKSTCVTKK